MSKIGQVVIVDNPDIISNSPNPKIANQGKMIINRIGICVGNEESYYGCPLSRILIGKQTYLLSKLEFSEL